MGYDDFIKKIDAGASLVQIYSGFIVKGPQIVKDILKD
jgi:dihydroorotate dehydrogenase